MLSAQLRERMERLVGRHAETHRYPEIAASDLRTDDRVLFSGLWCLVARVAQYGDRVTATLHDGIGLIDIDLHPREAVQVLLPRPGLGRATL